MLVSKKDKEMTAKDEPSGRRDGYDRIGYDE